MVIVIRHSEKAYKNGRGGDGTLALDPPLTHNGVKMAEQKFEALVDRFGPPNIIISSPFLRARQTAEIARNTIFAKTGKKVKISYNKYIGEFTGNKKHLNIQDCVESTTWNLGVLNHENIQMFNKRIERHSQKYSVDKNVWYVTHGIVVKRMCKLNGYEIDTSKFLCGAVITSTNFEVI